MRRAVSIFLVLFLGLGPFVAALRANEDARLPACCRRHGAHRCNMSDKATTRTVQPSNGQQSFTTASRCPLFPRNIAGPIVASHALVPGAVRMPIPPATSHLQVVDGDPYRVGQIRARAGRAPPALAS